MRATSYLGRKFRKSFAFSKISDIFKGKALSETSELTFTVLARLNSEIENIGSTDNTHTLTVSPSHQNTLLPGFRGLLSALVKSGLPKH